MLGTGQLQLLEPLEMQASAATEPKSSMKYRRNDDQCLALVKSLAGDMPLRLAALNPKEPPNVSAAVMRLRRFVRFYPAFAGAALFTTAGVLLASADFRAFEGEIQTDLFESGEVGVSPGMVEDASVAQAISTFGGDTLLHSAVGCPHSGQTCGILIARLR